MRRGHALWIGLVLVISCRDTPEKVTREQCNQVADHISEIIMDHYLAHPDELWDGMSEPAETGIPPTVTKQTFAAWLGSPEGKTWTMQRHGQVRSAAEAGIDPCLEAATPQLVHCLLATKTREDVSACDKKYPPRKIGSNAPATGSDRSE